MSFSTGTEALGPEARRAVLARLRGAEVPRTEVGGGPWIAGPLLAPTLLEHGGPSPERYASVAEGWSTALGPVLDQVLPGLHGALAAALGGSVRVPPGHAAFSVRFFPPGTASPWHTDNYRTIEAYADLRALTVDDGQLSWLVPLAGYAGGAVEIPERGERLSPAPGELLLFDGSRLRHRVAEVEGDVPRITLGGFAAATADGEGWFAWS